MIARLLKTVYMMSYDFAPGYSQACFLYAETNL